MAICSWFCCGRRVKTSKRCRSRSCDDGGGRKGGAAGGWRVFALKELHLATNSFNYDNKLGEGAFGSVYWGQLTDGSQITVKRLKVLSNKSEQEFAGEVEVLVKVRQKNLLNLRGYCAEGQERLLVYDFMPNSSVVSHLHGAQSADCLLDWGRRISIAIGAAEGIAYLHQHATPRMVHRGIKASNVLLDAGFRARVADFGFSRLLPDTVAHAHGTSAAGYLAPEHALHGQATEACDVYSFGAFLLELASGRRPGEGTVEWALRLARDGRFGEVADVRLDARFPEGEMRRVVLVALACAQVQPEARPTMVEVVGLLKGEAKDLSIDTESGKLLLRV